MQIGHQLGHFVERLVCSSLSSAIAARVSALGTLISKGSAFLAATQSSSRITSETDRPISPRIFGGLFLDLPVDASAHDRIRGHGNRSSMLEATMQQGQLWSQGDLMAGKAACVVPCAGA
jgi:hypothetical protein